MDLALNNLQGLICHKTQPTDPPPSTDILNRLYVKETSPVAILLGVRYMVSNLQDPAIFFLCYKEICKFFSPPPPPQCFYIYPQVSLSTTFSSHVLSEIN